MFEQILIYNVLGINYIYYIQKYTKYFVSADENVRVLFIDVFNLNFTLHF